MKSRTLITSSALIVMLTAGSALAQTSAGGQAGVGASVGVGANAGAGGLVGSTLGAARSTAGNVGSAVGSTAAGVTSKVGAQANGMARSAEATSADFSAATISKARLATRQISVLEAREHREIRTAKTASRRRAIETRARAERARLIKSHGLSVSEYDRIVSEARSNPSLASRIGLSVSAGAGAQMK
ncbi:DUF4168 domain-containing protein [Acidiphilium sp. JA12-A1]|uniref:DUF4168 domain-containing protein n=1 Tax=Acidiphilium sp. JA12-A1 TaxID=1464546 RepID=UPI0004613260|nr:DUF4168 domain-containing protein [Acidiphilium sp. JA12-A1]KDM68342.1 hypothetical protein DUF4168 [Acidiphilium sp. JA12-A1]